MARQLEVKYLKDHVEFRLSNKPEYLCKLDTEDYEEFMNNTNCWYIHVRKNKFAYIRRKCKISNGNIHLHREVLRLGSFSKDSVIDHKYKDTLDNRKSEIIHTDMIGNAKNSSKKDNLTQMGIDNNCNYRGITISWRDKKKVFQGYRPASSGVKGKHFGTRKTISGLKIEIDRRLTIEKAFNNAL